MRKIFTLSVVALLLALAAFAKVANLDGVIEALKKGNAAELIKYADDNVEIGLPNKSGTFTKAETAVLLKDFFANNNVKLFEVKHKGNNEGRLFCIGVLHTNTGSYRTQVFMNNKDGQQVIKLLSFQAQ